MPGAQGLLEPEVVVANCAFGSSVVTKAPAALLHDEQVGLRQTQGNFQVGDEVT
jgi:hypothetical protein